MSWKLQALSNELNGQEIEIQQTTTIGRHPDSDIVLAFAAVSRQHAVLSILDNIVWLQDAGSSNGTYVNDVQIDRETQLKDHDTIQFANLKFLLLYTETETETETATAQPQEPTPEPQAEKIAAQQMNEQGMPSLSERGDTSLNPNGMPQKMAIPVPAPIPEGVDIHAKPEPTPVPIQAEPSRVEQKIEEKKNASVGLISIIVLILVALIAWAFFK